LTDKTKGTRLLRDASGLAAARQSVGLSVEELAELTDVSPGQTRSLEAGGSESVLAVSSLQEHFSRVHGNDVLEEPA
jgi:hypothetical protein